MMTIEHVTREINRILAAIGAVDAKAALKVAKAKPAAKAAKPAVRKASKSAPAVPPSQKRPPKPLEGPGSRFPREPKWPAKKPSRKLVAGSRTRSAKEATRVRRRERKNIVSGVAHVNSTFNNTMITITDAQGNTISWSSAGTMGFKGSRKSTPFAAQIAAEDAVAKAPSMACARSRSRSPAPVRAANRRLRAIQAAGFNVTSIRDVTPIPHNGCRPRKRRRV
jgi:small subunit ribosomal protein S11